MLTSSDLIRLPCTPGLIEGGIAFACRSLASSSRRMGNSPLVRLRSQVGRVATELTFRHMLGGQAIPF
jgi:hypothetical protein